MCTEETLLLFSVPDNIYHYKYGLFGERVIGEDTIESRRHYGK